MSSMAMFLLCHGSSGDVGFFATGFMLAMAPISIAAGFVSALVRLIRELRAAR